MIAKNTKDITAGSTDTEELIIIPIQILCYKLSSKRGNLKLQGQKAT